MKLSGPFKLAANGIKPTKLVIFLHGVGADGYDLISLADEFSESLANAVFLSPNAPFKYDMYPEGFQWFSLQDYTEDKLYQGIETAIPILKEFIDENLAKYNLNYKDLVLIGFSQGTIMALQIAPRLKEPCTVIGFSGALVKPQGLKENIKSMPKILLIHGSDDQVLPATKFDSAMKNLHDLGFNVEGYLIDGLGHGISLDCIDIANKFLKKMG